MSASVVLMMCKSNWISNEELMFAAILIVPGSTVSPSYLNVKADVASSAASYLKLTLKVYVSSGFLSS